MLMHNAAADSFDEATSLHCLYHLCQQDAYCCMAGVASKDRVEQLLVSAMQADLTAWQSLVKLLLEFQGVS